VVSFVFSSQRVVVFETNLLWHDSVDYEEKKGNYVSERFENKANKEEERDDSQSTNATVIK